MTITDEDGFGPGQPGAAEMLLQGRIESGVGSPGSIMLAVPKGVWVEHGDITVHTKAGAGEFLGGAHHRGRTGTAGNGA